MFVFCGIWISSACLQAFCTPPPTSLVFTASFSSSILLYLCSEYLFSFSFWVVWLLRNSYFSMVVHLCSGLVNWKQKLLMVINLSLIKGNKLFTCNVKGKLLAPLRTLKKILFSGSSNLFAHLLISSVKKHGLASKLPSGVDLHRPISGSQIMCCLQCLCSVLNEEEALCQGLKSTQISICLVEA